jgi:hypothetical protein
MAEWMIDEFRSALSVVAQIWNETPAPIKTIVVAAFGTLIGAFLTSRSQAKRRVVEELRAIHAAYTICLATVNKALAIKRQHILPMKLKYDADVSTYDAWTEHPTSGLNLNLDLRTLSKVRFAGASLERSAFEKCSLGHEGLAALLSLQDAIDDLNASIDYRNNLISDFQKNSPPSQEERIAFYVGAYQDGKVDQRFSNNIEALSHQVDDCIFFGKLLSEKLFAVERKLRARNWWKYRLEVPRQYPADWTLAKDLIPDSSQYADWLKGFKKPPSFWKRLSSWIKEALGSRFQASGCGLLMIAWGIFAIGCSIYWFASGGNPENKKFFDDCYRRETRRYVPSDTPDYATRSAIAECTNQQRKALGLPDLHIKAAP